MVPHTQALGSDFLGVSPSFATYRLETLIPLHNLLVLQPPYLENVDYNSTYRIGLLRG